MDSPVWRIPEVIRRRAPEAALLLDAVNAAAWRTVSPVLLEEVRVRIAQMLSFEPGLRRFSDPARDLGLSQPKLAHVADYFRSAEYTDQERAVLGFVEQFVLDVSQFTPAEREGLAAAIGGQDLLEVVTAVYVIEYSQRLECVVTALSPAGGQGRVSPSASSATPVGNEGAGVRPLLADYSAAVMRLRELDPVTTELVRLRCARTHNCRICQTLRASDARSAGADDEMTSKVDGADGLATNEAGLSFFTFGADGLPASFGAQDSIQKVAG